MSLVTEAKSVVTAIENKIDSVTGHTNTPITTGVATLVIPATPVVKTYSANVTDLATTSANFKALSVSEKSIAAALAATIAQQQTAHDAALAVAAQADATAASIDAILAPIEQAAAAAAAPATLVPPVTA